MVAKLTRSFPGTPQHGKKIRTHEFSPKKSIFVNEG